MHSPYAGVTTMVVVDPAGSSTMASYRTRMVPVLMHIKLKQLCCARVLLALCGSVSASNNIGYMLHMCDV